MIRGTLFEGLPLKGDFLAKKTVSAGDIRKLHPLKATGDIFGVRLGTAKRLGFKSFIRNDDFLLVNHGRKTKPPR